MGKQEFGGDGQTIHENATVWVRGEVNGTYTANPSVHKNVLVHCPVKQNI